MAKITYIAFLALAAPGFELTFPDLEGCRAWGATESETLEVAKRELSQHLERLAQDGVEIPPPSDLSAIAKVMARRYFERREPTMYVGVEVEAPDAAERVNVYLNKGLLERIDNYARQKGVNRSEFLALAARHYMGEQSRGAASPNVEDFDSPSGVGGFQTRIPMNMRAPNKGR